MNRIPEEYKIKVEFPNEPYWEYYDARYFCNGKDYQIVSEFKDVLFIKSGGVQFKLYRESYDKWLTITREKRLNKILK